MDKPIPKRADFQNDVYYYRAQLKQLTPPKSDREQVLVEIYEQLLAKHGQSEQTDSPH